jgi:hypothetical protein
VGLLARATLAAIAASESHASSGHLRIDFPAPGRRFLRGIHEIQHAVIIMQHDLGNFVRDLRLNQAPRQRLNLPAQPKPDLADR